MIPLAENHLCRLLQEWVGYYNTGRPHLSLGPASHSRLRHSQTHCKHTDTVCLSAGV
jgi:transposase InsO family protein